MAETKIRVLQIIGGMNLGGAENFLMNIYRNIDRDKIQFDFLVNRKGAFDDEIKELGGKIFYLPALQKVGPIIYKMKLRKFFREHSQYKIVHSHLNQVSGIILECAKKESVPVRIAHSHSSSNNTNNFFERMYKNYLSTKINKNATVSCACSKVAAEWLYKKDSDKAIIINNAIDIDRFKFNEEKREKIRKELRILENEIVLGHVGRLCEVKNHKFLIKVFNEYQKTNRNSKLLLVGDGPLRSNIENQIKELDLVDKVILVGNKKNVEDYYNAMDVFVFPSLFEGLPLTVIEAQISGLPCYVSENVSTEVKVSETVKFCSIINGIELWVDLILNNDNSRKDEIEKIKKSGYDIKSIAKNLQEKYLKMKEEIL